MPAAAANRRTFPLYESGVRRCEEAGVELAPADFAALWEAAKRCIEGDGGVPALLEAPVRVGNVWLYPRTLGAAMWWEHYGKAWFGGKDPADEVLAIAWMLAHAREGEMFRRTTVKAVAVARMVAWQIGLAASVTLTELAYGVERLFAARSDIEGDDGADGAQASASDWGSVIAYLCATYGQKPEHFLWEVNEAVAVEMMRKAPPPPGVPRPSETDGRYGEFVAVVDRIKARAVAT